MKTRKKFDEINPGSPRGRSMTAISPVAERYIANLRKLQAGDDVIKAAQDAAQDPELAARWLEKGKKKG